MTTYTQTYFIKGNVNFDPGNGWIRVVKTFVADTNKEAIKRAKNELYPDDSLLHKIELEDTADDQLNELSRRFSV